MSQNKNSQDNLSSNPLLHDSNLPHLAVPFPDIKLEHFLPALKESIRQAKAGIEKISKNPEPPTFANTIEAMEISGERVDLISHVYYNLLSAETSDELQALASEIGPLLSNLSSDILHDGALFLRVKSVYENADRGKMSAEQITLLEDTYVDFTRNGALLDEAGKEQLRKLDEELSKLGPAFNDNVLKATNAFELHITDEKELSGLPQSAIEAASHAAEEKQKSGWLFTLDAPSFMPFLKYSDLRDYREKMWRAYACRCVDGPYSNSELVLKIIRHRHERANLLGYPTHADFVLRKRMAESPQMVHGFLEKLLKASKPAAEQEIKSIATFAQGLNGPETLMPWDLSYYAEKYKKEKFHFDEEELRPYFQLEKTIDGVFTHARLLYGLSFKESAEYPRYHKDVKVYEVSKEDSGQFIGLFYADFFPRPSKKGGAWMTNFREQGHYENGLMRPHVGIVCNFTKPTPGKPSLLSFLEVQTLFHEFGHALHSLLSQCYYRSQAGTSVYWDFVELPSQVLENWTYEKEALDLFARHYETGEKIPEALAKKIKDTARFMAGYNCVRQVNFGLLDMAFHDVSPDTIGNVADYEHKVTEVSSVLPQIPGTLFSTAFSHIFGGGYSAGYYSYKWAEVLDADAFEYFKSEGLFNRQVAEKFETNILSRGGTEHPMVLYKRFRGREPDPDALLRRDGLI